MDKRKMTMCGTCLLPLIIYMGMCCMSCGAKAKLVKNASVAAKISIADGRAPEKDVPYRSEADSASRDSIVIRNIDGHDLLVMKAVKDEEGNLVASRMLNAATVTAKFRNVAERHGKVDIGFIITVPGEMIGSKWQLRYCPTLFLLDDSLKLDKVMVTGRDYRRKQLRGYQHYQRFLESIINDSSLFIRKEALEIFLKRNIPQLYSFKSDSSFVSEEHFNSVFGVSQQEAVEHYTRQLAKDINERKRRRLASLRDKYIKVPLASEGIRLDSVVVGDQGDWTYHYVHTIRTRPGLRKIDVVLDGSVYEQDRKICDIARSEALRFYISSVSSLIDETPHYLTRIIERRAEVTMSFSLAFQSGKWTFDKKLGNNMSIMNEIGSNCSSLMDNKVFCLDSILVCASASPEGSEKANNQLSSKRSQELSRVLRNMVKEKADSIKASLGCSIDLAGGQGEGAGVKPPLIISRHMGEDWSELDRLVENDSEMNGNAAREYFSMAMMRPLDTRETAMSAKAWYHHVRSALYPKLRRVNFTFLLHRRSMLKDTIHTTVLDSTYMEGVQAIRDRDYDKAIELLRPYNDYNAAIAYCAKDFNHSALAILDRMEKTAAVNYMLALLKSRFGDEQAAVEHYMKSCSMDDKFIHRGNLDPEISYLIKKYGINNFNQN